MEKIIAWIDARLPWRKAWEEHASKYYAPKNFNFWYYFGSLALLVLVLQIVTGIFLTMHYKPDARLAFASVEYIMRDVPWGWLIRYMHSTGASMFFVVIYLHMLRALMYGSYKAPRELVWIIGMLLFLALMGEAFMGYLLPWGNMSYWGAQVIINLFSSIPFVGESLSVWIRGDYAVTDATLNRFFSLHVIAVPLGLILLAYLHLIALHQVGSNNPDGIEIKQKKDSRGIPLDGVAFHPYYTAKDTVGAVFFLIIFFSVVFFAPEMGGWFLEHDNFAPASVLHTPEDIKPLWYFTPFYSILRAVTIDLTWIAPFLTAKFLGVMSMGAAVVVFFFLPWLDRSPVKSIRYRGWIFKLALSVFVVNFIVLGYLGTQKPEGIKIILGQIGYFLYFGFFVLMPWYTKIDKTKPVPERVTQS